MPRFLQCGGRLIPGPALPHGATGTVIPAQDSVFAAANVGAFIKARGGQGLFVVGPFSGQLLGSAASVQLAKPDGTVVAST